MTDEVLKTDAFINNKNIEVTIKAAILRPEILKELSNEEGGDDSSLNCSSDADDADDADKYWRTGKELEIQEPDNNSKGEEEV